MANQIDKDFISQLILLLSYESSYSHDPATIIDITQRLSTGEQYDIVRESIKIRIGKPKLYAPNWTQQDFLLLFRKHRLLRMLALSPSRQSHDDNGRKISTILFNITSPHQQLLSESEGVEINLMENELQTQFHVELLQHYHRLQTVSPSEDFSMMVSNFGKNIYHLHLGQ